MLLRARVFFPHVTADWWHLIHSNHSRAGKSEALLCSIRMRLDLSALRKITYKLKMLLYLALVLNLKSPRCTLKLDTFRGGSKTILDAIECTPSVLFCTTITSKVTLHSMAVWNRSLVFIHSFKLTTGRYKRLFRIGLESHQLWEM